MIYFVRPKSGGRIKIGTSIRLTERLKQLALDAGEDLEVLAVVDGSYPEESALHQKFSHLRATGEWFEPGDDLLGFIVSDAKAWDGTDDAMALVAVTMKGSEEWKEWLERAAAHSRMSVSMFLDFATVQYAKSQGFDEPPPDR